MVGKKTLTDREMTERIISIGRQYVPEFKVIDKRSSLFHKTIGRLFPAYMAYYWTTIGYTAAYPAGSQYDWASIAHEIEHARQSKKYTRPLFYFLYLFPVSLVPLFIALGFIFNYWYFIAAIISLLPIPAIFRSIFELEGYKTTIRIETWMGHNRIKDRIEEIAKFSFGGAGYYFMWPFKSIIKMSLAKAWVEANNWKDYKLEGEPDPYHWALFILMREIEV